MKRILCVMVALACAGAITPVFADPDKDESGHGRYKYERHGYKGGEHKEEYWEGNCKIERKWEKSGEYKEERKCEGPRYDMRGYSRDYPPPYYQEPGVILQPPAIVIQPPPIILKK